MSQCTRHTVRVQGASDTQYLPDEGKFSGIVREIRYVNGTLVSTTDFVISSEATGEVIFQQDNTGHVDFVVRPSQTINAEDRGNALVYDVGGNEIYEPIIIANDRIKFVMTGGSGSRYGDFTVIMETM